MIYDELTGTEPVTWSYLLHTTSQPMEVNTLSADAVVVTRQGNTLHVAGWTIDCNLNAEGAAAIRVTNNSGEAELAYSEAKHGGATLVKDKVKGKRVKRTLKDELPDFEI